ncbi:MAG: hypothetical protein ABR499_16055 [Gemmatimonadaceae bacterium]
MSAGALVAGGAPVVRSWALYAASAVALIVLLAWLLTLGFTGPQDAAAIRLSAVVACVVQLAAFAVTRALTPRNVVAGWGAGALLRFLTLVVYALLAVKVLGVAPVAALVSLATFLFLSTLIEPLFLRR